ncbi:lectin BRA-3-like [Amphibalanus amphitrite]|nr:lectin BRA-3-like [Amphibalanus amphitrite]XP_043214028.1 lectin BRA-3-like [Amphibalanus amphitrite]XP_043214029.1 lectin BRA-3-like [Amphibalanus amphitrite]
MSPLPSLLLTVLMSAGAVRAGCPTNVDWVEFEDFCYWRSTYPSTWAGAVAACQTLGESSQLASIHSLVENSFIMQTYNYAETWIGLNDIDTEGQFVWSDGTDVDFTNWRPGQPDNHDNEDCVEVPDMRDPTAERWNDGNCDLDFHFICKMPASS